MIKRVVLPLDGSVAAETAIPHALCMAGAFEAGLLLARVVAPGRAGAMSRDAVEWRLDRDEAERYLRAWAGRMADAGQSAEVRILEGDPAGEIVRVARPRRDELLALTTHGSSEATEFRLGGTAEKLISGAGCSVLVVRSGEDPVEAVPAGYRRILAPVDGSHRGDWALCLAATLARHCGAELVMAHVITVPEILERTPGDPRTRRLQEEVVSASRDAAERYLDEMRSQLGAPDLAVTSMVTVADQAAQALHRTIEEADVDLVVTCAHGRSGSARWPYGSVVRNLISYGGVPLLVLQDQPAGPDESRARDVGALEEPCREDRPVPAPA